jgi:peptide deformylase
MEEHLKAAKAQGVGTPSIDIPKAIIIEELDELPESMSPDWYVLCVPEISTSS